MTGRASVDADEEIIKLARDHFVAVAGDNWYRRRRKDAEGDFFAKLVEQSPASRPGRRTFQGTYCLTSDGKLLTYRNHRDPAVMRRELEKALFAWENLPPKQREPGSIEIEEPGRPDPKFHRSMPPETLLSSRRRRYRDGQSFG